MTGRTGHIWAPQPDIAEVRVQFCPTEDTETEMLCQHFEWLGWDITCLSCGEKWGDGERLARPFERGWRERRIEEAKQIIKQAPVKRVMEDMVNG